MDGRQVSRCQHDTRDAMIYLACYGCGVQELVIMVVSAKLEISVRVGPLAGFFCSAGWTGQQDIGHGAGGMGMNVFVFPTWQTTAAIRHELQLISINAHNW